MSWTPSVDNLLSSYLKIHWVSGNLLKAPYDNTTSGNVATPQLIALFPHFPTAEAQVRKISFITPAFVPAAIKYSTSQKLPFSACSD